MSDKLKITFIRNYSPRKKGEVVLLQKSLAEFYVNNDIAEITKEISEKAKKEECIGCNGKGKKKKTKA